MSKQQPVVCFLAKALTFEGPPGPRPLTKSWKFHNLSTATPLDYMVQIWRWSDQMELVKVWDLQMTKIRPKWHFQSKMADFLLEFQLSKCAFFLCILMQSIPSASFRHVGETVSKSLPKPAVMWRRRAIFSTPFHQAWCSCKFMSMFRHRKRWFSLRKNNNNTNTIQYGTTRCSGPK